MKPKKETPKREPSSSKRDKALARKKQPSRRLEGKVAVLVERGRLMGF